VAVRRMFSRPKQGGNVERRVRPRIKQSRSHTWGVLWETSPVEFCRVWDRFNTLPSTGRK